MSGKTIKRRLRHATIAVTFALVAPVANATVVEFQTVLGNFEVNLYDNATPETVANFLNYVNNGRFTNSIFHRNVPGFVTQGGGFTFDMAMPLNDVPAFPPVVNEPVYANVRGTIAMAKVGGDPDSATSQFFFNLGNNTANLDFQNGGFAVFGEVVGNGMDVVDAIAALPDYDFGGAFTDLPLRNYTQTDYANSEPVDDNHLVIVSAVVVSDSTVDSAAGLNPPLSTAGQEPPSPPPIIDPGGGSGSFGIIGLLGLLLIYCRRLSS
jgi:peptidyl-prolyl cis-trans isomerase A (cyclophilin A)